MATGDKSVACNHRHLIREGCPGYRHQYVRCDRISCAMVIVERDDYGEVVYICAVIDCYGEIRIADTVYKRCNRVITLLPRERSQLRGSLRLCPAVVRVSDRHDMSRPQPIAMPVGLAMRTGFWLASYNPSRPVSCGLQRPCLIGRYPSCRCPVNSLQVYRVRTHRSKTCWVSDWDTLPRHPREPARTPGRTYPVERR